MAHTCCTPGALVLHWPALGDTTKKARVDARAAVNAQLHNVAVAAAIVRPAAMSALSLNDAAPFKSTT